MTLTPVGAKNGQVFLSGLDLPLEEWNFNIDIDNDAFQHFGQDANTVTGLICKGVITGAITGLATVKGKYDSTAGQDPYVSLGLIPDAAGFGYLGWDELNGINIAYVLVNIRGGAKVDSPGSGMVEFDLKIIDWTPSTGGPGDAGFASTLTSVLSNNVLSGGGNLPL